MTSGTSRYQPESARGTIGISTTSPAVSSTKPHRMMPAGRRLPAFFPASNATPNIVKRQRGQRQTRLHGVVLQHHLQVDRQRDHGAAQRDLLQHLLGDPEPETLDSNRSGSISVALRCRLRRTNQ